MQSTSFIKIAENYLTKTKKNTIYQTDLLEYISNKTGKSKESIRGSIIGPERPKMGGFEWFKNKWVKVYGTKGSKAKFVKKHLYVGKIAKISYDTSNKQKAREFIFKGVGINNKRFSMLTMAGPQGLDVKYVLNKNPKAKITNVEKRENMLSEFKTNNLNCKNFLGKFSEFLKTDKKTFRVLNYDSMGYLCDYVANDLKIINDQKKGKYVAITLINIKKVRNHGKYADYLRDKYENEADITLTAIKDILHNYRHTGEFVYSRDPENGSRPMRVLKFELKKVTTKGIFKRHK